MKTKNTRLWVIIAIVALNSIGFSIVLPLLPFLVGQFLPEKQVVVGMSALLSVYAVFTFFAAPILGALSDKYGRKIVLTISLMGSVAGYVLFGIGGALWILFLSRIIDGLTAGNISTLFAYISDTTEPQERSKWFGYIGAAMGIGKIGGPALGGMLGSISISLPFYLTAGLIFLSGLAVYFFLPESLAHEKRTKQLSLNSFNTFSHFKDILSLKGIAILLIIGVLFYSGLGVFQFNFTVFLKDVYSWTPVMIGGILTFVGIFEILSRAVILPFLLKHFKEKSISVLGLSLFSSGLAFIFMSTYLHSAIIIALSVIFIISGEGLFDPTYIGKLSQSVDETRQGKLQGVNQSIQSLINIIIPLAAAAIYFQSPKMLYLMTVIIVSIAIIMYSRNKQYSIS